MLQKHGLKHEICITLMALPPGCSGAHDAPFYMKTLDQTLDSGVGFDLLCFKDASGTATPAVIHESIKEARKKLGPKVHIRLHTHETAGTSAPDLEGGARRRGGRNRSARWRPCPRGLTEPNIATMWHALRGD